MVTMQMRFTIGLRGGRYRVVIIIGMVTGTVIVSAVVVVSATIVVFSSVVVSTHGPGVIPPASPLLFPV